jgi:hypothetical protein
MATQTRTRSFIRHPDYVWTATDWDEWRITFRGGKEYRDRYLKKWSDRETSDDYALRKSCTPITTFAKAAILDIRNSIFQRLEDVIRKEGSNSYQRAVKGEGPGVDREGTSMDSFIGIKLLTDLLVMGRTGVYVDAPNVTPATIAQQMDQPNLAPYCYCYPIEDILSWELDHQEIPGTYKAVLLRDYVVRYNTDFSGVELPEGRESRLRLVWRDESGNVRVKFFTDEPEDTRTIIPIANGDPDGGITLDIPAVPFYMPDIGESLMIDIVSYQHALLNLASGDVNWSLMSSSPFLTIQRDLRSVGSHLKQPGQGNTPEAGGQRAKDKEEQIGGKGRYYDLETDRPGYIAPPTDPLMASLKLQEKLEDDIRKLVNLAVANKVGSRTESAEAKKLSSQGLEAGLSFIGTVLQDTEQKIAEFWAMYEADAPALVSYPARYILKQDVERIEEATQMARLIDRIPSKSARKSLAKQIVLTMLAGKESSRTVDAMLSEIDRAGYTSGVVQEVIQAHSAGLVSDMTASDALGYDGEEEVEQARQDKAERATITLMAQTSLAGQSGQAAVAAGARGVPEIDPDEKSAKKEKEQAKKEQEDG